MEIKIVRAGMLTTVQDLGRRGHRASGVPLSGAMDAFALRVANLLVGNAENAAALEFTLRGPELEFSADTVVAVGRLRAEAANVPGAFPGGELTVLEDEDARTARRAWRAAWRALRAARRRL